MQNGKMNQQIYLTPFAILSKARRTNISPEASSRESGNPGRLQGTMSELNLIGARMGALADDVPP
jgi:hypothetical protein